MNPATVVLAVVGTILTLVAVVAAAVAVWRSTAIRAILDTFRLSNEELRESNNELRRELADEREKRAILEGKVEALTSELADQIVAAVMRAMRQRDPHARERSTDT